MTVLIVAKTILKPGFCVGAIDSEGNSLRLFERGWQYPGAASPYEVGQEWDMDVEAKETPDLKERLVKAVTPWAGSITGLYEGKLKFTGKRRGYIVHPDLPSRSTWFWRPDKPLLKAEFDHKVYYRYDDYEMSYVGVAPPIDEITSGTLVRISLAGWWKQPGVGNELPERCYLQLSGWYA
jgi:hypothetical protein